MERTSRARTEFKHAPQEAAGCLTLKQIIYLYLNFLMENIKTIQQDTTLQYAFIEGSYIRDYFYLKYLDDCFVIIY